MRTIIRLLLKAAKMFFLWLPLLLLSFSMAAGGLVKFLGSLGLQDWQSNEHFYILFQGLPGLIYAITSFLAGAGFVTIISHKILIDYLNFTLVPKRFTTTLKKVSWMSLALLLLLWFIGDSQRSDPIIDRQTISFEASGVRGLEIDFPGDQLGYYRKHLKIIGENDASEIRVEIMRKIGAWNKNNAEEKLKNYLYVCELDEQQKLRLGGQIAKADWNFFPYPEIEFTITVPKKQLINLTCRASDSDKQARLLLEELNGPISIAMSESKIELKKIDSPELKISNKSGSITLENISASTAQIETESGRLKATRIKSQNLAIKALSSTTSLFSVDSDQLKITSQSGNTEINGFSINLLNCSSKSGTIKLLSKTVPDNSRIEAFSESGTILVYLPQDLNPAVNIESNRGIIGNEFKASNPDQQSPSLQVKTITGSIRIRKQDNPNQSNKANSLPAEAY